MAITKLFFKSIKRSTKLTKNFIIRHFSVTVPKRYPKGNDKAIFNKISESAMTSPKPPLPKNISTTTATSASLENISKGSTKNDNNSGFSVNEGQKPLNNIDSLKAKTEKLQMTPENSTNIHFNIFRHKVSKEEPIIEKNTYLNKQDYSFNETIISDKYQAGYLNNKHYVMNSKGKFTNEVNDPDHITVTIKGPNDSLAALGRTTSHKGGNAAGELTNIKLSHTKYNGSHYT